MVNTKNLNALKPEIAPTEREYASIADICNYGRCGKMIKRL
jgi:hypothetical protein